MHYVGLHNCVQNAYALCAHTQNALCAKRESHTIKGDETFHTAFQEPSLKGIMRLIAGYSACCSPYSTILIANQLCGSRRGGGKYMEGKIVIHPNCSPKPQGKFVRLSRKGSLAVEEKFVLDRDSNPGPTPKEAAKRGRINPHIKAQGH